MGEEQLHVPPSTTFNSFRQRINIVLTKDGIRTLADVVIIDSMQVYSIQGFATSNVAQTKERSYRTQHPTDQFLLLTIEIFDCL
jgi:hypothetical protein